MTKLHTFATLIQDIWTIALGLVLVLVIILYSVIKYIKFRMSKTKNVSVSDNKEHLFNNGDRCIMLYGSWGSGKTHYYEKELKEKIILEERSDPIYISCFGANKEELIVQFFNAHWLGKNHIFHTIVYKLFINYWKNLMPTNKVIVFDDLERLHEGESNYLDLIGIIDFLKKNNKILLIASSENISSKIFNSYSERVVDRRITKQHDLKEVLEAKPIYNDIVSELEKLYNPNVTTFKNLRIIKNIWQQFPTNLNEFFNKNNYSEIMQEVTLCYYKNNIINFLKVMYLSYHDNALFSFINNDITLLNISNNPPEKEKYNNDLSRYGLILDEWITFCDNFINNCDIGKIIGKSEKEKYDLLLYMLTTFTNKKTNTDTLVKMVSQAVDGDTNDFYYNSEIIVTDYKNKKLKDIAFYHNIDENEVKEYLNALLTECESKIKERGVRGRYNKNNMSHNLST